MTDNFHYSRGKDGRQLFVAQWDHPPRRRNRWRSPKSVDSTSPKLLGCWKGRADLPGMGITPKQMFIVSRIQMRKEIPSEMHVQKFNGMSSPGSSFGTFE